MTKHDIYVPIESPGDLRILHALLKEAGEPVNALDAYAMDNFGKYESGVDINTLNVHNLAFWNGRWILTSVKGEKKITQEELRRLLLPDSKYVGKWLKGYGPHLMYITSESAEGVLYGYGLSTNGQWSDYSTPGTVFCAFNSEAKQRTREATYLEVKDALIGQAKDRGFDKESFSIKEAVHPTFSRVTTEGGSFVLETTNLLSLYYGGITLFHEGKWAELKEEAKFSEIKREMKTFTEHMQDCVGATHPLEIILHNLTSEEIEEEVHIYAKEVAKEALRNASSHFDEKTSLGQISINVITSESNIPEI